MLFLYFLLPPIPGLLTPSLSCNTRYLPWGRNAQKSRINRHYGDGQYWPCVIYLPGKLLGNSWATANRYFALLARLLILTANIGVLVRRVLQNSSHKNMNTRQKKCIQSVHVRKSTVFLILNKVTKLYNRVSWYVLFKFVNEFYLVQWSTLCFTFIRIMFLKTNCVYIFLGFFVYCCILFILFLLA